MTAVKRAELMRQRLDYIRAHPEMSCKELSKVLHACQETIYMAIANADDSDAIRAMRCMRQYRAHTTGEIAALRRMAAEGYCVRRAANELGCSYGAVWAQARKYGIKFASQYSLGRMGGGRKW